MKPNIRPLGNRIIVKRAPAEEKSPGGILLPDVAKERPQRGEVTAVGPGKMKDDGTFAAMAVVAGDLVLYSRYAGDAIKPLGDEYLIMREDDILAVIEKS